LNPEAENIRFEEQVQILTQLATTHNVDFWPDRH
jgi:hypothetical protein